MNIRRPEKIKKCVAKWPRTQTRYTYALFSELLNITLNRSNLGVALSRTIEP